MTAALDIIQCNRDDWEDGSSGIRCDWSGPRNEAGHDDALTYCPGCEWIIEAGESDAN